MTDITHTQFINAVAEATLIAEEEVDLIIDIAAKLIVSTLTSGDKVVLTGFGTFEPRARANNTKGVPPTRHIGFKAGVALNDTVKGNYYDQFQPNTSDNTVHSVQQINTNNTNTNDFPAECDDSLTFIEGATKKILVNAYERDEKARAACVKHYGSSCQVCSFDFAEYYGEIGSTFIHVHHIKPLSHIKKEYIVDPINDLRPVCPNCHAMLHTKNPPYTVEALRTIMDVVESQQQG